MSSANRCSVISLNLITETGKFIFNEPSTRAAFLLVTLLIKKSYMVLNAVGSTLTRVWNSVWHPPAIFSKKASEALPCSIMAAKACNTDALCHGLSSLYESEWRELENTPGTTDSGDIARRSYSLRNFAKTVDDRVPLSRNQGGLIIPYTDEEAMYYHGSDEAARAGDKILYFCTNEGCNRSYTFKKALSRHIRHECGKEPRFQCCYCGYKSLRAESVRSVGITPAVFLPVDMLPLVPQQDVPLQNLEAEDPLGDNEWYRPYIRNANGQFVRAETVDISSSSSSTDPVTRGRIHRPPDRMSFETVSRLREATGMSLSNNRNDTGSEDIVLSCPNEGCHRTFNQKKALYQHIKYGCRINTQHAEATNYGYFPVILSSPRSHEEITIDGYEEIDPLCVGGIISQRNLGSTEFDKDQIPVIITTSLAPQGIVSNDTCEETDPLADDTTHFHSKTGPSMVIKYLPETHHSQMESQETILLEAFNEQDPLNDGGLGLGYHASM
ncbi:hypothetical protein QAD02_022685 [Eretmocerus hayati]|uniref:Uncharacterized protein n=1 Tax=Eretmocerus hayati TaxID=131215 RepID=A0ACC2PVT2_9HYME|nr:hypothetical protein QAD02_022685 [Eretmocerus hayati]